MKRATVVFTEMAESDILEQADWYELQSSQSLAQKWHKAVTSTILRIIQNPFSGVLCAFSAHELKNVRRMPVSGFPKHLVFYEVGQPAISILRIIHGARDLESLF